MKKRYISFTAIETLIEQRDYLEEQNEALINILNEYQQTNIELNNKVLRSEIEIKTEIIASFDEREANLKAKETELKEREAWLNRVETKLTQELNNFENWKQTYRNQTRNRLENGLLSRKKEIERAANQVRYDRNALRKEQSEYKSDYSKRIEQRLNWAYQDKVNQSERAYKEKTSELQKKYKANSTYMFILMAVWSLASFALICLYQKEKLFSVMELFKSLYLLSQSIANEALIAITAFCDLLNISSMPDVAQKIISALLLSVFLIWISLVLYKITQLTCVIVEVRRKRDEALMSSGQLHLIHSFEVIYAVLSWHTGVFISFQYAINPFLVAIACFLVCQLIFSHEIKKNN